ncbi:D-aminoacylase [Paenibacillus filicis]|uniref:D-aminoacylase n=1 Tax=Paenibacillus gyeongsangnamensis TaxID=3388067 RepID=A0ABT4Q3W1_9BACL|nr:D-aminoacylase [Paenibacillus filicis]MCZ8511516.1 D-aminoacylase [Paenibacillus filicis]
MYELVLRNGLIVDGTGSESFIGDIALDGELIVEIGQITERGRTEIDTTGLVICPGFIDSHTHSDLALLHHPESLPKISQGVTTEILGNCGFSVAPIFKNDGVQTYKSYSAPVLGFPDVSWDWESYSEYLDKVAQAKPAVNFASLIGHGTIRSAIMGFENRKPTSQELNHMKAILEQAMKQGALGLSTGLVYAPGAYSDEDEIIELARVIAKYNGVYATHLRNQADGLVESVKEAIKIGKETGVSVHISHHKTVGKQNFGLVNETLTLLDQLMKDGVWTSSDMYPYLAGNTTLAALLPSWLLEGGVKEMLVRLSNPMLKQKAAEDIESGIPGWENRMKAIGYENVILNAFRTNENKKYQGMRLTEIAHLRGEPVLECAFHLLLEEGGEIGVILMNSTEEDLIAVLQHSRSVVGSDGIYSGDTAHPRLYGTFPRIVKRYVHESKIYSLEEGIHRMTGLTAQIFRLDQIGFLKPGLRADVVVFDPATIEDCATYEHPQSFAKGIQYVIVGGKEVLKDGKVTGIRNGKALFRKQV